jgi:hypothetical protein
MGQLFIMNDLVLPLRKTPEQKLDKQENNTQIFEILATVKSKNPKEHF